MSLSIYFGVPGCGKSTHAASVVYHNLKKGWPTYCNFPVKGAFLIDDKDIGKFSLTDCYLIIDEASITYNSRKLVDVEHTPEKANAEANEGQACEDHQDGRTGDSLANGANPTDSGGKNR